MKQQEAAHHNRDALMHKFYTSIFGCPQHPPISTHVYTSNNFYTPAPLAALAPFCISAPHGLGIEIQIGLPEFVIENRTSDKLGREIQLVRSSEKQGRDNDMMRRWVERMS